MIYTHKRKASKLQIFQVRNSTPSAGVRPSLCEDGRQRDVPLLRLLDQSGEGPPEASNQSAT